VIRLLPIATAAIALTGLASAGGASAQGPAADACAGLPTQAEEIACLRGALQESRAALAREREAGADTPVSPPAVQAAARQGAAPAVRPSARAPEQLGAEQVANSRREAAVAEPARESLMALAQAVRTDHLGQVTLRLDNGQVWQQAEARGVPLRLRADRQYPVEISASGFGGYRMHFTDMDRRIVVRRLQ
jgi:hypothetical protein